MATTKILREDQLRATVLVTGTGAESTTTVIGATQFNNYKAGATGVLSVENLNWSFDNSIGATPGVLYFDASTDEAIWTLAGQGEVNFKRDFKAPATPNTGASGYNGNILLTYTGDKPWSFVITVLKDANGFNQYYSYEPIVS